MNIIDLSKLPAPQIIEELSFETIFNDTLNDFKSRDTKYSAITEGDPAYKVLQAAALRELLLRQENNEKAKAVLLAYASDAVLEHLAALFGLERQLLDPGDLEATPPIPPVYESDNDLRYRVQLALEGYSTAGPEMAYIFHALSVTGVKDAKVKSPNPGEVLVTILSRNGNGTADSNLMATVSSKLNDKYIRPLTDHVTVQSANIVNYQINATIYTFEGPDPQIIIEQAQEAADLYTQECHKIDRDVNLSGIYKTLHQEGVKRVILDSPLVDVITSDVQAAYCTQINIINGGNDE